MTSQERAEQVMEVVFDASKSASQAEYEVKAILDARLSELRDEVEGRLPSPFHGSFHGLSPKQRAYSEAIRDVLALIDAKLGR